MSKGWILYPANKTACCNIRIGPHGPMYVPHKQTNKQTELHKSSRKCGARLGSPQLCISTTQKTLLTIPIVLTCTYYASTPYCIVGIPLLTATVHIHAHIHVYVYAYTHAHTMRPRALTRMDLEHLPHTTLMRSVFVGRMSMVPTPIVLLLGWERRAEGERMDRYLIIQERCNAASFWVLDFMRLNL